MNKFAAGGKESGYLLSKLICHRLERQIGRYMKHYLQAFKFGVDGVQLAVHMIEPSFILGPSLHTYLVTQRGYEFLKFRTAVNLSRYY